MRVTNLILFLVCSCSPGTENFVPDADIDEEINLPDADVITVKDSDVQLPDADSIESSDADNIINLDSDIFSEDADDNYILDSDFEENNADESFDSDFEEDSDVDLDENPCESGFTLCDSGCVDLMINVGDCGECGNICSYRQSCINGECRCLDNQTQCQNGCFDLSIDINNCGRCGRRCGGRFPECIDGDCYSFTECLENVGSCGPICSNLGGECSDVCTTSTREINAPQVVWFLDYDGTGLEDCIDFNGNFTIWHSCEITHSFNRIIFSSCCCRFDS